MNYEKLAELLFPHITKTTEDYEALYPARALKEGARVTRFAPSPTGYLHIGGLFGALVDVLTAKATEGVSYLRIEDTDKKREIDDGVSAIINGFNAFGIDFDEGVTGFNQEKGAYGPYTQSQRAEIYQTVAKDLVKKGLAYPCFCTAEELSAIREQQEKGDALIWGYFGKWAKCRDLSYEEIEANIKAGKPYVLRFRSDGQEDKRIFFDDIIRGKIEMPENIIDEVLLKSDGIPTYHFAHACDDHFMRTTHVIRGEEWISSVPKHIALFKACGFRVPKYAHTPQVMKIDEEDGTKRKLSKRKDPEAAVSYFVEQGFPKESLIEYLLTLLNSNFEDWRKANPTADAFSFPFNLKKMSPSGCLFDLVKLTDVSKNVISVKKAEDIYTELLVWSEEFDKELNARLVADKDFAVLDPVAEDAMKTAITSAKLDGDSVGGILETAVVGMPAGVGEPWFDTVESVLAHILFGIPAVKGVEFGCGFAIANMRGSEANDAFVAESGHISTQTNNSGGILGGITSGMPLIIRCAVKPTPSIYKEQATVDFAKGENVPLVIHGRHDPAIVHRARVVVDSAVAIALCDLLATRFGTDWLM